MILDLRNYANREFLLDKPQKDGSTLRQSLMSVFRQTGIRPSQLVENEPPMLLRHVIDWFGEINAGRTYFEGRPMPLSNMEIFAWCALTRTAISPFELRCLREIDACYLNPKSPEDEQQ